MLGCPPQEGGQLSQYPVNSSDPWMQWSIEDIGGGSYKFLNRQTGYAADVYGGSTADGKAIIGWTYTGGNNQLWSIEQVQ